MHVDEMPLVIATDNLEIVQAAPFKVFLRVDQVSTGFV